MEKKISKEYIKSEISIMLEDVKYQDIFTNKEADAYFNGFIEGIQWYLEEIKHDMKSDTPQAYDEYKKKKYPQIPCIVLGQLSSGYGYGVRYWNIVSQCWDDENCDDYECDKDSIEFWWYLDDIISKIK